MTTALQNRARKTVDAERLYEHVTWFSQVRRDTGGPGEDRAAEYIAGQLRTAGVPVTVHEFDAYLSYPIRATLEVLAPEAEHIRSLTHSFGHATGPDGAIADLVYLEGGDVNRGAGRAALIDGLATPVTILQASKAGCAAVIFANEGHVIHNMIGTTIWGTPDLDQLDRQPRLPVLSVDKEGGETLKRLLAQDKGVRLKIVTEVNTGWFRSRLPEVRIPGMKELEQFVLVGGHYCGWEVGATDNGTGDACLIELARILWENRSRLRRGVRVCWWPGHSHGRYSGSTWYADTFFTDLAEGCLAYHNIDSPGVRGATRYVARHTSAEADKFCQSIIERVTGQANVTIHRPMRAADQSFLANGVPSFSTYPLLPLDHPDRWPWTGGSANAWWWHSEHDTLDKTDKNILALDTQISLTAVLELANAETLPFEHVSTAQEIYDFAVELQDKVADHLDLSRVLAEAKRFQAAAQKLEDAKGQVGGDPAKGEKLNVTLMRLSRVLNPVIYSQRGRFQHDPAEWSPIMRATGRYTLAALGRAVELPHLAGKTTYGFLRAQAVRERNRVVTALHEAVRLTEGVLALL
jgi:N-acetylated-alpha-linked acidic dipeptidase